MLLTLLTCLYVGCALLLTLYSLGTLVLLAAYWRHQNDRCDLPPVSDWPIVAIQLPLYNEANVVPRLLAAVAALKYPRDRLIIQVLDDSTDKTVEQVAFHVAELRRTGLNIQHVRRPHRHGYKAGALAYGLSLITCDLVAVLDADFVPAPDFLRLTVPYLVADPALGMVQARWGHLNTNTNLLTRGQTLSLDGHFVVDQTARSRAGWLMSFNGSGGIWRTRCIQEAGGWQSDTLSEDLDLSYRAQLVGWRFLYLPHVVVPAELPPQIAAYKQQQARWAKGSTQCLIRLIRPLWRAPRLTLAQRVMATLHLLQYMPHPLMVLLLLLTPPLMLAHRLEALPLGTLGLAGLGPPLIYMISQRALYRDWYRRLLAFPVLLAIGTGIAWANSLAVLGAFFHTSGGEFRRTPKFALNWEASSYAIAIDYSFLPELFLACYALWGVWLAARLHPALVGMLSVYAFSFGLIALWSIIDMWRVHAARRAHAARARGWAR